MLFRNAAAAVQELRAADPRLPWGDSTPPPNFMVGTSASGMNITGAATEQIAAVYGCCALLADSVASLPMLLRNGPDRAIAKVLPPSPLLNQPYAEMSRIDWWVQFVWALALRGNFFGQIIERDRLGYPVQIKPIHNDGVQVDRSREGKLEYRYYGSPVSNNDVFHVRNHSTAGNIMGLNPIQVCALAFGLAHAQDQYAESFFHNQASPHGVIEVPGELDNTETKKMLRSWLAAHQGLNNAHLPAILTEGAEFKPITISPADSQLLEALGFSEQRICGRIFRIPPHMVGMVDRTTSWGKGIEQQERGFFTNTLVGYLTRGADAMTAVHPPNQYCHFDSSERLRGTALERAQTGSLAMLAGAWCADDFRATFDMKPLPDGDGQYTYAPVNTQLLLQALETLKEDEEEPQQPAADGDDGTQAQLTPGGGSGGSGSSSRTNGNGNGHGEHREQAIRSILRSLGRG